VQLDRERLHDQGRIAIIPAGLCYPGAPPGAVTPL
jgi:hypothetical protein